MRAFLITMLGIIYVINLLIRIGKYTGLLYPSIVLLLRGFLYDSIHYNEGLVYELFQSLYGERPILIAYKISFFLLIISFIPTLLKIKRLIVNLFFYTKDTLEKVHYNVNNLFFNIKTFFKKV